MKDMQHEMGVIAESSRTNDVSALGAALDHKIEGICKHSKIRTHTPGTVTSSGNGGKDFLCQPNC